jgi:hypothetical protein
MHHLAILALLEKFGSSGFDDMLRLFGIAAIISVVFRGIKALVTKSAPTAPPAVTSTPAPPAPQTITPSQTPPAGEISPQIIAIIAAAVASFTDHPQRIISIRRQSTSWEKAGRQSVLTSHRIR